MKDLSLHILDIVQNSIVAEADQIHIGIEEQVKGDEFRIEIRDNGRGMTQEEALRALEPFVTSRKTRHVGMGLPLFKQNAEQTGGNLAIESVPGKGTLVKAVFGHSHIDRPPLGDIADTFVTLMASNPQIEFQLRYSTDQGVFDISSSAIDEVLEGVSLNNTEIRNSVKELINENIKTIKYRN